MVSSAMFTKVGLFGTVVINNWVCFIFARGQYYAGRMLGSFTYF